MTKMKFEVLAAKATINGNKYPMYTGFLQAVQLMEIAEVPSFSKDKAHHRIADDVSKLPIDEWQRPEEIDKIHTIKEIYGDTTKDNLMANPVLLGTAKQNILPPNVDIILTQKTVKSSTGEIIPIPNHYEIEVTFDSTQKKPIWILDGQHRIKGLSISKQKNELIPFVLLHDSQKYTPPYLAEIFTHVTTGAKPMDLIHGEWMKFAFNLGNYQYKAHKSAMETTIVLCREPLIANQTNPFNNLIQFNPHLPLPKWNAFEFTSIEWEKLIATHYYAKQGKLSPVELAEEIVKSTIKFEELDTHKNIDSKIFSSNKYNKILAESYLIGLFTYLSQSNKQMALTEWEDFYLDPRRAVNRCNFSLPFVKTTGALSSNNGTPSKQIATACFIDFFCNPNELNGNVITDFLQGIGGVFKISAYSLKKGRIDKKSKIEKRINYGPGITPFDLSGGGIDREVIFIEACTSNLSITSVSDTHYRPARILKSATKKSGENISKYANNYEIDIEYMSYSGDTRIVTQIRLDK
jgi:hypothetical protein